MIRDCAGLLYFLLQYLPLVDCSHDEYALVRAVRGALSTSYRLEAEARHHDMWARRQVSFF
jgi:hypothetical protein